jgi:hypothetical protein
VQIDTIAEWQRLTQLYREKYDEELLELNDDITDLTEVAQQVLRDEIRSRGLQRQPVADEESRLAHRPAESPWDGNGDTPKGTDEDSSLPHEFTWKTALCECDDKDQIWQIQEVLRQAGIESWVEGPGYHVVSDLSAPRILVAADQLEEAREIISRPIPQAIIDASKQPEEEYQPPVCPKCGTADPVLEGADPVNNWLCESCGAQWSDPGEDATESAAQ